MMPWTVNESYKHLITGHVLHEAEKRGAVAFPGHIPLSFKRKVKGLFCFPTYFPTVGFTPETLSSISHLQRRSIKSQHGTDLSFTWGCSRVPPLFFLLSPPHAGPLRVCYCWFLFFNFMNMYSWCNRQHLRPPDSQLFTPLSMPSVQHHFFVRTPPRALGEMHVLITVSFP